MDLDLNDVDVPENVGDDRIQNQLAQIKQNKAIQELIKKQYREYEDLGDDLLMEYQEQLDENGLIMIFRDLIPYVNENIITLGDIDNLDGTPSRLIEGGKFIYTFVCLDQVNSILPTFLESIGCSSIEDLDKKINTSYATNIGRFRNDYLKIVQAMIEEYLKLTEIDQEVVQDKKFRYSLAKLYYFQEIVMHGDMEKFLHNYVRPEVNKYMGTMLWKII